MRAKRFAAALVLILALALTGCAGAEAVYDDNESIADPFSTRIATRYAQNYLVQFGDVRVHAQADYFSGVSKVCDIELGDETFFDLDLTVKNGKFKAVLVRDGEVTVLFENNGTLLVELSSLARGEYELKFVGQQANFELDMTIRQSGVNGF